MPRQRRVLFREPDSATKNLKTSKTPDGRSATYRVQDFFWIHSLFLTSIAARFLVTFHLKNFSRLGEWGRWRRGEEDGGDGYPLEASFFLSMFFDFFELSENDCRTVQ